MITFVNKTALAFINSIYDRYYHKVFGKIGEEKLRAIRQVIPAINNLQTKIGQMYSPLYYVELASSTDIHNITEVGRYVCPTDSVAGTLVNCPTKNAFVLYVEYITSTMFSYTIKDYKGNNFHCVNYVYSDANHFTDWYSDSFSTINLTAPTVYQNRVVINDGGYYQMGKLVIVNLKVSMTRELSANNWLQILTGFPVPANECNVSVAAPVSPCNLNGLINTYGALELRNRELVNNQQVLYINGVYVAQ